MKLSIIIVSWNTADLTLKCVKSVFKFLSSLNDLEVLIVDNASPDKTVENLENFKKENLGLNLKILAQDKNLGFAKANNLAIKKAQGDFVFLLNPDTELIDNSLLKMLEFMQDNPAVGVVGPKLLNSDKTLQRSCRRFPKLADQILIQLKFYNLFPQKFKVTRQYFMLDFNHNQTRQVDQVMGAAMLVRNKLFNQIGLLDENFWAIFEEVDFCARAKKYGWQIWFFSQAKLIHHKEQSFKHMASLAKQKNYNRSLRRYFAKHKPLWQLWVLKIIAPFNLFLTWLDTKLSLRAKLGKSKDV